MHKIKVSEATNTQLDWLVTKSENHEIYHAWPDEIQIINGRNWVKFSPSTDPSQMWPIIEREGINLSVDYQDFALSLDMVQIGWKANLWNNSVPATSGFLQWATGPTPLIAAARCYVMSKLGEEVEVPEELT